MLKLKRCWKKLLGGTEFLLPPIPNTLFQRDPSCWIYNGVTCNPMYWPARKPESLVQRAIYKFHPIFKDADFHIWWGDSDEDYGNCNIRGRRCDADRQRCRPDWNGRAHDPSSRHTSRPRIVSATSCHPRLACLMPKSRAAMHLDTVFTFCDRDLVTIFREVVDQIRCYIVYPTDDQGGFEICKEPRSTPGCCPGSSWTQQASGGRDWRKCIPGGARAMG